MMQITSTAFAQNAIIPQKYTCMGKNVNPPILITGVPKDAKSLALIVEDPDAPSGNFTHWILWNIDPATKEIKENSIPKNAASGKNDIGNTKYLGPCPPSGTHRYFFTIFALDTILDLKSGSDRKNIDQAMAHHIMDSGQLMAKFSKQ